MGSPPRPHRRRPIRFTLACMFVVPLASLIALWGFAASVTLGQSVQDSNYNAQYSILGKPAQVLGVQLAAERLQSFIWLSSGDQISRQQMDAERAATNTAVTALRHAAIAARGVTFAAAKPPLAKFIAELGQLDRVRAAIDAGTMNALSAFQAYSHLVDTEYQFYGAAVLVPDVALYRHSLANVQADYALELAGREAALVEGALAAQGHMTRAARELFTQTVANQRYAIRNALAQLGPALRGPYARVYASPAYAAFKAMEDRIASTPPATTVVPVAPEAWQTASQAFLTSLTAATKTDAGALAKGGSQLGSRLRLRLGLAGGAGLLAVIASIFVLLRFGRRIARELTAMRAAALTLAEDRLPKIVERLKRGSKIDVAAEATPFRAGTTSEVADLALALSSVQRTAMEAAVGQARLRESVNQVFVNLARRNQSLLHRQLDMLDALERDTADPDILASFFRIDHLTTRMRRHAESLIILSGEVPGRGWRTPVQIVDVLRAAVAEVEDYVRVDVVTQTQAAIVGAAVADVIHLLAELIENATVFSPPNTHVVVTADAVANGFAIEVEDRGLGIEPAELADINNRLANPPEFDLADSDRLGLFVVGQLAARHQIKVALRETPFGGTSAIVLLPYGCAVSEAGPAVVSSGDRHREPAAGSGLAIWSPAANETPAQAGADAGGNGSAQAMDRPNPATSPLHSPPSAPSAGAPAMRAISGRGAAQPHTGAETYLGLPRRVRQASLAPQLRDSPVADVTPAKADGPEPASPEETRARVASMQRGWQRGRIQADPRPGAGPTAGPGIRDPGSLAPAAADTAAEDTGGQR
jgi:signal transduction histidine kinase